METPNNPLQELQFKENQKELRKRNKEKELKQIAKLQKKQRKKNKNKNNKSNPRNSKEETRNSVTKRKSGSSNSPLGSFSYNNLKYEINTEELNKQKESKIQQQLKGDLNSFLINQIVLGQQFFQNYDG